jgi:hypothetical protein
VGVRLSGVPQVDDLALGAEGRLAAAVGLDDGSVQDHVRQPVLVRPLQRLVQVRGLFGEHVDDLVPVAVSRGAGYAVVAGQRVAGCAVAEPAHAQHRLQEAVRALLPRGVPRRRRSAASSLATKFILA